MVKKEKPIEPNPEESDESLAELKQSKLRKDEPTVILVKNKRTPKSSQAENKKCELKASNKNPQDRKCYIKKEDEDPKTSRAPASENVESKNKREKPGQSKALEDENDRQKAKNSKTKEEDGKASTSKADKNKPKEDESKSICPCCKKKKNEPPKETIIPWGFVKEPPDNVNIPWPFIVHKKTKWEQIMNWINKKLGYEPESEPSRKVEQV